MKILAVTALSDLPEAHLIRALAESGVELDLVSDARAIYHSIWDEAAIPNTRILFNDKFDAGAIHALRRKMRQGRYDLFHAFSNRPLTNAMIASLGIRIGRVGYCGTTDHLRRWDPACRVTFLSRRLHRVGCVSGAVRDYLLRFGIADRALVTIHKGHDPDWYHAAPRESLQEFRIPESALAVACVANVRPVKGVDVLLETVRRLPADSRVHVLIIGEVRDESVQRAVQEEPLRSRIHLAGFREDATALLGACDVSVMPSVRSEGLPKAVIESMCMGVPPVVSRVGGLPEVVEDGRSGMVVPPSDPDSLAAALSRCESSPDELRSLGNGARERILERFHLRDTVRHTIAMYEALLREIGGRLTG